MKNRTIKLLSLVLLLAMILSLAPAAAFAGAPEEQVTAQTAETVEKTSQATPAEKVEEAIEVKTPAGAETPAEKNEAAAKADTPAAVDASKTDGLAKAAETEEGKEAAPAILAQPENREALPNADVNFHVALQGKVKSFSWELLKAGESAWTDLSAQGGASDTLTIRAEESMDGAQFRCVVTFEDGKVLTSEAAKLSLSESTPAEDAKAENSIEGAKDTAEKTTAEESKKAAEEAAAEESKKAAEAGAAEEAKKAAEDTKKAVKEPTAAGDPKSEDSPITPGLYVVAVIYSGTGSHTHHFKMTLWTEDDGEKNYLSNRTVRALDKGTDPVSFTTDGNGTFTFDLVTDGTNAGVINIEFPENCKFSVEEVADANSEFTVLTSAKTGTYSGSHLGSDVFYSCLPQSIYISCESSDGKALAGCTLQIKDDSDNVLYEWVSDGSVKEVKLLPGKNHGPSDLPYAYYTLCEVSPADGYAVADDIRFNLIIAGSVLINNTTYNDNTIHIVSEPMPGSLTISLDFDTLDGLAEDTRKSPFVIAVDIDGLTAARKCTLSHKAVNFSGDPENPHTTTESDVWLQPASDGRHSLTINMRSTEVVTISGLPAGATYTVQEINKTEGYEGPVYDGKETGTIPVGDDVSTVITNTVKTFHWSLTKSVPGYDRGDKFPFLFYLVDDYYGWGDGEHLYYINGKAYPMEVLGYEANGTTTRLGAVVLLGNGDTISVPNIPYSHHYYYCEEPYYNEESTPSGYVGHSNSSGGMNSSYDVVAVNSSCLVGIKKVDQNGDRVAGAKLQILAGDGTVVAEMTTSTEEDSVWVPNPYQYRNKTMTLHEAEAPKGYLPADDIQFTLTLGEKVSYVHEISDFGSSTYTYEPYEVRVNGQAQDGNVLVMTDAFDTHDIQISKQDLGGKEIAGAELTLTGRPKGAKEDITPISWTSEAGKSHMVSLLPGSYVLTEKSAPDGYEKAERVAFTVAADGTVTVDGSKVKKVVMVDCYESHDVLISKQNLGGKEIAGAKLTITGKELGAKKDIAPISWTTKAGKTHKVSLRPGSYVLTEKSAPDGYEKAESIAFSVAADGTVTVGKDQVKKVIMVDKAVKKSAPKTGDDNNLFLWTSLLAASSLGMCLTFFLKRRRKGRG